MSYVMDNLLKNERILYEARLHWSIFLSWRALISLFIWPAIVRSASEFAVTNRRVIIKTGIIQRRTLELNLGKVESIEVDQTFWGRLFGYGSIEVIGTGGTRELFEGVGDPLAFRKAVHEATESIQPSASGSVERADPSERLAAAQAMRDKGQISPEEFEAVRKRILEEM